MKNCTCNRGVLLRLFLCVQPLCIIFYMVIYPNSILHELEPTLGSDIWYVLIAIVIISLLGIADTFINDCLSHQWKFTFGLHLRNWSLMSLGLAYAVLMNMMMHAELYAALPFFISNIAFIVLAAFVDIHDRYKDHTEERKEFKNNMGKSNA